MIELGWTLVALITATTVLLLAIILFVIFIKIIKSKE